ncbi:MAG: sigma-70 family RNA polymerase sigma factor [Acidobacteria bacterium]|nr:sigma-70 family RNA polymerase sigma factor [Acidobacteriota bacterium]
MGSRQDDSQLNPLIERIFRNEHKHLVSVLTRIFGPHNLALAEDVVQESFMAALTHWQLHGLPDNPSAWLMRTGRNRAVDAIRKTRTQVSYAHDLTMYLESEYTLSRTVQEAFDRTEINDDLLRMIFMCCRPEISTENSVTLILKTLLGLSVSSVARALLTQVSTINKRLLRVRKHLQSVRFDVPEPVHLNGALEAVHTSLYLMFNEGAYSTNHEPIRQELCREALYLVERLTQARHAHNSETVALSALMCFHMARLNTRMDTNGKLIPLDQQDRTQWDRDMIDRGLQALAHSTRMERNVASRFHLEAAIASRHCTALSFADTDWRSICKLYNRLLDVAPSTLVALNRAVAISYLHGPGMAIDVVKQLEEDQALPKHNNSIQAVLAVLYQRIGETEVAQTYQEQAIAMAATDHERDLLQMQIDRARSLSHVRPE